MITNLFLSMSLVVLLYCLIRTVVNEIKRHITKEADRVIKVIKGNSL